MQAIQTKYLSPTNSRGARIKATCAAGSITISYPYELSGQACHRAAVEALMFNLSWDKNTFPPIVGGQLKNGDYVFVFNNEQGAQ
jgi:hypothetical protein